MGNQVFNIEEAIRRGLIGRPGKRPELTREEMEELKARQRESERTGGMDDLFKDLEDHGIMIPNARLRLEWNVTRADIEKMFNYVLARMGRNERCVWNDDYDAILDWMNGSDGKNLFIAGGCGLGKTIFGRYVIPAMLYERERKVMTTCSMYDAGKRLGELLRSGILSLDDIGVENESVTYGERRDPFVELVENIDANGKLAVFTSNIGVDEMKKRYGERTVDRLVGMSRYVGVKGKSMRR